MDHVCFVHLILDVPSVALQDGEHDDVEGGVGGVQHLLPRVHAQACHLLQDNSDGCSILAKKWIKVEKLSHFFRLL